MSKNLHWKHLLASCLFSIFFLSSFSVEAQTTLYVNDGSTSGDAYTSTTGDDLTGTGSQSAPFATIAKAMSMITTGAVYVDAGSYTVNGVTIKPGVKLAGLCPSSSTIIVVSTLNVSTHAELSKFTITRVGTAPSIAVSNIAGATNVKINNCYFTKCRTAIYLNTPTGIPGAIIESNDFNDNRTGMVLADASYSNLVIRNNNISNNRSYGIIITGATSLSSNVIENNNITGNLAGAIEVNGSGAPNSITLTNNWFGTPSPVMYPFNTNGQFTVDDHTNNVYPYNFTDINGAGTVPDYPNNLSGNNAAAFNVISHAVSANAFALPGCCVVTSNNPVSVYPTIQAAINSSNSGATITLCTGQTYNEQVLVNKSVTIQGNGASVIYTGIVAGKPTLFDVSANNVTINNVHFKVDLAKLKSAIIASNSIIDDITITNNIIDGYGSPSSGTYGDRNAVSINYSGSTNYGVAAGGVNNVQFHNNTVNIGPLGAFRSALSADEAAGSFTGNILQSINHDILLRFVSTGPVNISGNNFKGGGLEFLEPNAGAGSTTITNNTFNAAFANTSAANTAVLRLKNNQQNKYVEVSGNKFFYTEWAVSMENFKNVFVHSNEFTPLAGSTSFHHVTVNTKSISSNSATIVQTQIFARIENNIFNGSGVAGGTAIGFYDHDANAASFGTFDVHQNSFDLAIANDVYIDNQVGVSTGSTFPIYNAIIGVGPGAITLMAPWTALVNSECNWYGTASGALIATKVGTNVDYTPWLINGTDSDPATGFQTSSICSGPDADSDGVSDDVDNCPTVSNPSQINTDGTPDGGDACDLDDDNDGISDAEELICGSNPLVAASTCETCDGIDNDLDSGIDEGFTDTDGDGAADCVDADDDNDGVADGVDNCPFTSNSNQLNTDGDSQGDACDPDDDNDGELDGVDCAPLDQKNNKVIICHSGKALCVQRNAVAAHIAHGDTEGPCPVAVIASKKVGQELLIITDKLRASSYPNPFTKSTKIQYNLPYDCRVSIKVYDMTGRAIATLVSGERKAGNYFVEFDASKLGAGNFYYRINATSKEKTFSQIGSMIRLK